MERYFFLQFVIFCIFSSRHEVKAVNECSRNPCCNGATCVDDGNYGYTCQCATYWIGRNCEIPLEGVTCGTNHYSLTGNISSPNYPNNYNNSVHCFYLIKVHGARTIRLNVLSFKTQGNHDRLTIRNSCGGDVFEYTGYYFHLPVPPLFPNEIWLEFTSDSSISDSGWIIAYYADKNDYCIGVQCMNGGLCENSYDGYYCRCQDGWSGNHCEIELDVRRAVNECLSDPCLNGGECVDKINWFYCKCKSGFCGVTCDTHILSDCANITCLNGGSCVVSTNGYSCSCTAGWSGEHCGIEINVCSSQPCLNNGTCNNDINLYACDCLPGWSGNNCEIDINECSSQPCLNGGTCNNDINLYTCDCLPGWTGDNCEIDINECSLQPCLNGGTCNNDINLYTCDCLPGWTGDNCEIDINECSLQPCLNGGTCIDYINLYICDCLPGWRGDNCEIDFKESSEADVTDYLMTIVLGGVIVIMVVAFIIFYRFCHMKNKETVVNHNVPTETVKTTTPRGYMNQVPVVDENSVEPQTDKGYLCHPKIKETGHDTEMPVVHYDVPDETVETTTPSDYVNQVPVAHYGLPTEKVKTTTPRDYVNQVPVVHYGASTEKVETATPRDYVNQVPIVDENSVEPQTDDKGYLVFHQYEEICSR